MIDKPHYYFAEVVGVYSGDTCTLDIDLGLNFAARSMVMHMARLHAPEVTGEFKESGKRARDFLREIVLNKTVVVKTNRSMRAKRSRYSIEMWAKIDDMWKNVNDIMIDKGFAQPMVDN